MTQGQTSEPDARRVTQSVRRREVVSVVPTVLAQEFLFLEEEVRYTAPPEEVVIPVREQQSPEFEPKSDAFSTPRRRGPDLMEPGNVLRRAAPLTRLKYNRFQGDGGKDVDDWLDEFVATAQANQEDPESRFRVFSGLLKGEALKWYLDVPEDVKDDWERLTNAFVHTFQEAGGEARPLSRLSTIKKKKSESVRRYGQRVKALINKVTTDIAPIVTIQWYVAGFPNDMACQIM
jgi:hypothetical protein